jgi:D-amino-acid oxidase
LSKLQSAGYNHGWFFETPIVDSPKMMESFLEEIQRNHGNTTTTTTTTTPTNDIDLETGVYYNSISEMIEDAKKLGCDTVVNCTGMGAARICQDEELVGGRGVLLQYDRKSCVRLPHPPNEDPVLAAAPYEQIHDACVMVESPPFGSDEYPCYMIPRGDTIVVGGTYLEGDDEMTMRPQERERLLENASILGIDTDAVKPKGEWVGIRPYRKITRCEVDDDRWNNSDGIRLIHSYGSGGSGWTVYAGIAKDVVQMILTKQ